MSADDEGSDQQPLAERLPLTDKERRTTSAWRATVSAHIAELHTITLSLRPAVRERSDESEALFDGIHFHLREARTAIGGRLHWWQRLRNGISGADIDGAMSHYTAAEVLVLRLASTRYEQAMMPSLLALARQHLASGDPRLERMEQLARRGLSFSEGEGVTVAAIVGDVGKEARREIARTRSFRNVVWAFMALLSLLSLAVGVFGAAAPGKLPLCFEPERLIVCPTSEQPVLNSDALVEMNEAKLTARQEQAEIRSALRRLQRRERRERRALAAGRRARQARRASAPATRATDEELARSRSSTIRARAALRRTRTALRRLRRTLAAATAREREAIDQAASDEKMREDASDVWDVPLVLLIGLLAGAVAAAASLRNNRGTALPFKVPVALALLKLPAGALTAFLGIELMRGGFVPGLSALDSSAQIVAWAIVFGSSQQLLTRLVDRQGETVIDAVRPNRAAVAR